MPDYPHQSVFDTFNEFSILDELPTNLQKQVMAACEPITYSQQQRILSKDEQVNKSILNSM
jgi:hypothetical protein